MPFWNPTVKATELDLWNLPIALLIPLALLILSYRLRPRLSPISNIAINSLCYLWSRWHLIELLEYFLVLSPIRPSGLIGQFDSILPPGMAKKLSDSEKFGKCNFGI